MSFLPRSPRLPSGRRGVALAATSLLTAACGLPTEIPQVDQTWIVPPSSTTIAVASLLPSGVGILPDSSAFTLTVSPVTVTRALSADCASCAAANGTTVPKPAFVATASVSTPLPTDIASATLTGGSLKLDLTNNYNFDPLRPSATAFGYVVITIANGGTIIGRDSLDGATSSFAPGTTHSGFIPIAGTITSASPITVTVTINSPAGDPITIDASRTIVATATPSNLRVASASLTVTNRQISASRVIDLTGVDDAIITHTTGGAILLDIANPFNVTGTVTVTLASPGVAPVTRTITLASGTSHPSVTLSGDEVRSLFGHVVTVTFSGPVSGSGPVTVTPKQVVTVTSRLELTLHTGTITP